MLLVCIGLPPTSRVWNDSAWRSLSFGDHRIDRTPRLVFRQGGRCLEHRGEVEERNRTELEIAFLVHALRIFEEAGITGDVSGIEPRDFRIQLRFVVRIVKFGPVVPQQTIERMDRQQGHIIRHVAARKTPQLLQAGRIGDDCGSGIERVSVALPDIGASARSIARFDNCRGDPRALQADG